MHRLHAQRKHILQSLDILLYQLHVLAFFISPSIWTLIFRLLSQSQCSKSRELDTAWSLRAFFALLVSVNIFTIWSHATSGASDGKAVILDFIGMAYPPSKFRLLSLDLFIVFLQMLLATIAYETSFAKDNDSSTNTLLSSPNPSSNTIPDRTKVIPTPDLCASDRYSTSPESIFATASFGQPQLGWFALAEYHPVAIASRHSWSAHVAWSDARTA
ncbi:DUF1746 domain-containing protein [Mycena venus]|uniref:DUF1746 domain-containing protein n=1 Tax=Mycena venus TaxID=2733690 RepID=A0A8H6YMP0_9AGAR|nr:DUF1746 domain-containing protein [Mycena venus]